MDLVQVGQFTKDWRKTQWDVDHTVVGQGREQVDNGGFVTTTGTGGDEDTGWLVVEGTLLPQTTCGVDESLHLGWQVTESGWETKENTVGLCKNIWGGNWVVWFGWSVHLGQDLLAEGLCDLVDGCLVAGRLNTLLHLLSEGGDVVVHGVDDDCDVSHYVYVCFLVVWLLYDIFKPLSRTSVLYLLFCPTAGHGASLYAKTTCCPPRALCQRRQAALVMMRVGRTLLNER